MALIFVHPADFERVRIAARKTRTLETANQFHGAPHVSRTADDGALWDREGGKLRTGRISSGCSAGKA